MFSQYYHIKGLQKLFTLSTLMTLKHFLCVFPCTLAIFCNILYPIGWSVYAILFLCHGDTVQAMYFSMYTVLNTGHFALHIIECTLIVLWKKLDEIDSYAYILYVPDAIYY
ncbi:hypothetical protein ACJX0J_039757, partial [Zea mays]